jgi:hypothetical protein
MRCARAPDPAERQAAAARECGRVESLARSRRGVISYSAPQIEANEAIFGAATNALPFKD